MWRLLLLAVGYAKYCTDIEAHSIPLKTLGPTTQMIGDLPYKRLQRPVWFPDRHDGVTTPTIRQFASASASAAEAENAVDELAVAAAAVVTEPAAATTCTRATAAAGSARL